MNRASDEIRANLAQKEALSTSSSLLQLLTTAADEAGGGPAEFGAVAFALVWSTSNRSIFTEKAFCFCPANSYPLTYCSYYTEIKYGYTPHLLQLAL
jgi:hypothetical protein